VDSNVILTADPRDSLTRTYGVQSWGPDDVIAQNLILSPVSTHFTGVAMHGQGSWAEANIILPIEVKRHTSDDINRSVGGAVGNRSRETTSIDNETAGLDVGNGPLGAYQAVPRRVISHFSTNDGLAVDPRGLTPDSLP
jgi:hypothetical protein